jgi:hypothetical protein
MSRVDIGLILLLATAAGQAAAGAETSGQQPVEPSRTVTEKPVEVRMEEVEIKGEIERPGVFYIIPRREVQMDLGRQTRDYTLELSRPLDPAAFERWVRLQPAGR